MEQKLRGLTNSTNVLEAGSQKQEVRSKKQEKNILHLASCFLFLVSCFLFVENVNAKECTIMEPEVLKRYIENKTIYNMLIFDVRPQFNMNMKRISRAIPITIEDIKKNLVDKVDELVGKDVILIGENIESAERVCKYMMIKDYGIRNIYVLKGGMEKWDGPLEEDFSMVECSQITSRELINIIKSNRKVEIIDQRKAEEYHEGHIPGARSENMGNDPRNQLSVKNYLKEHERGKRWKENNITAIYVYPNEFKAMRECRYVKYWYGLYWGYKDIYVLRGGMKAWEGEVEKDYLEILKKKVKEKLK